MKDTRTGCQSRLSRLTDTVSSELCTSLGPSAYSGRARTPAAQGTEDKRLSANHSHAKVKNQNQRRAAMLRCESSSRGDRWVRTPVVGQRFYGGSVNEAHWLMALGSALSCLDADK